MLKIHIFPHTSRTEVKYFVILRISLYWSLPHQGLTAVASSLIMKWINYWCMHHQMLLRSYLHNKTQRSAIQSCSQHFPTAFLTLLLCPWNLSLVHLLVLPRSSMRLVGAPYSVSPSATNKRTKGTHTHTTLIHHCKCLCCLCSLCWETVKQLLQRRNAVHCRCIQWICF